MDFTHDAFISYSHRADAALARVLERGLEGLARPTFRLRAIDVFRDLTGLAASPGVWSGILEHLSASRWLIFLASPLAADSAWCRRELRWWLDRNGTQRLLIVLTDGDVAWDDGAGDFDWSRTTALPRDDAAGRFPEMPLFVDLRWVRGIGTPAASDPRLRAAFLDLAAPVRGLPKDQLDGEDVRQLRRTRWLARSAVAAITVAAALATWQAVEAQRQRRQAEGERELSVSRQLAAQATQVRVREPVLALLLAAQSQATAPSAEAQAALIELARSMPFERLQQHDRAFSSLVAHDAPGGGSTVWAGDSAGAVWRLQWPGGGWARVAGGDGGLLAGRSVMTVSPDGRTLAASGYGGSTWLLTDGAAPVTVSSPVGKEQITLGLDFSPDQRLLAVAGQSLGATQGNGFVVLHDRFTGTHRLLPDSSQAARVRFSPDGRWLAVGGDGGTLALHALRPSDRPPTLQASRAGSVVALQFADAGRQLFVAWSFGRIDIIDTETGQLLRGLLSIANGSIEGLAVAPDGLGFVSTHSDGSVRRWDATGAARAAGNWADREVYRHPQGARGVAVFDGGTRAVSVDSDGRLFVTQDLRIAAPQRRPPAEAASTASAASAAAQATGASALPLPADRAAGVLARLGSLTLQRSGRGAVLTDAAAARALDVGAPVDAASFSADGAWVYTLAQGRVQAWRSATGAPGAPAITVGERASAIVPSADGRWLAVLHAAPLQIGELALGARGPSLTLLALPDLQLRIRQAELDLGADDFSLASALFSGDGRTLVLAGTSQLNLWELGSLRRVDAAVPLGSGMRVLGFSRGRWPLRLTALKGIGTPVATETATTLDLRGEALTEWACALAGRALSRHEWVRYLGNARRYAPRCPAVP